MTYTFNAYGVTVSSPSGDVTLNAGPGIQILPQGNFITFSAIIPPDLLQSVSNTDGTLTISPTTGSVVASLNLAHANTWTGKQTFNTSAPLIGTATASTIAGFDASKNLITLATATYPSLTELSYVKGVTSAIQTQLGTKLTNPMTSVGDLIQGTTAGAPVRLASVATGNALISGGVTTASSWGKIGLTTHVSGTLPVANGGTGQTTPVVVAASFSGVGAATTVFTVTIGTTQANTTYKVAIEPTNLLAAAVQYVTNKTTTTFDVTYIAGLTGTVTFDWALFT